MGLEVPTGKEKDTIIRCLAPVRTIHDDKQRAYITIRSNQIGKLEILYTEWAKILEMYRVWDKWSHKEKHSKIPVLSHDGYDYHYENTWINGNDRVFGYSWKEIK